jgi:hypothetical protein
MTWQDLAFSVIQVYFIAVTIPILTAKEMPTLWSSVPFTLGNFAIAFVHASYPNWFAMSANAINGLEWAAIAYMKWQQT